MGRLVYPRIAASLIVLLFLLVIALFILITFDLIGQAFRKLGFPPEYSIILLILSLLGSYINIPVREITSREAVLSGQAIDFYWFRYILPPLTVERRTIIAINLGGAVIPVAVSVFLLTRVNLLDALTGILIMTLLIHMMARPVRGLGIAVPALIPPIMAAVFALIISPQNAPMIAYISGTLGSLIGADLLNLKKIPELQVAVASIGGAGTFDGIFLTGIISVLIA
ncbi:MAG: DUF1614 domain-containing protein [Candidatus Methanoperedens sp.]|nr:DUF1614 domain-containing protein [Candidatus Methanoperedens sp.]MCZ7406015.1 DUF1614 domain-containing protein [Candidatus Methanoperedens sp.]